MAGTTKSPQHAAPGASASSPSDDASVATTHTAPSDTGDLSRRWRIVAWTSALVAICAGSFLLRLPYFHVALTSDEGGYAYIAYFWDKGQHLYTDLWVDRPQLLLLVYQTIQHAIGSTGDDLRVGGAIYNIGSVLAVVALAWRVFGARFALLAGAAFAWFSAAPHIEGFTTNGELLTTLPSTIAIVLIVIWVEQELVDPSQRWHGAMRFGLLALAGGFGGCSFLLKQSGIDAPVTLVVVAVLLAFSRKLTVRRALLAMGVCLLGALIPVAISVTNGLLSAGHDYFFAIYTYRVKVDGFFADSMSDKIDAFFGTLPSALLELGPLLVLLPFGVRVLWRRGWAARVVVLWLIVLCLCLMMGGSFHAHYYVSLVPALVLCGVAAIRVGLFTGRTHSVLAPINAALLVCAVWGCAAIATDARLMTNSDKRAVSWSVFHDHRYLVDRNVGLYLRKHSKPNDRVFAMYADADLYYYAQRLSPYPYLWAQGIKHISDAVFDLRVMLEDPRQHPDYIAMVQDPDEIDHSGELQRVVEQYYARTATVDGVAVYRAQSAAFAPKLEPLETLSRVLGLNPSGQQSQRQPRAEQQSPAQSR